jgi:hypothetical protein
MEELRHDPYPNKEMLKEDKEYVIKKLGLSDEEFENIMAAQPKSYKDYQNLSFMFHRPNPFVRIARQFVKRKY